jgi:hypothetical protein
MLATLLGGVRVDVVRAHGRAASLYIYPGHGTNVFMTQDMAMHWHSAAIIRCTKTDRVTLFGRKDVIPLLLLLAKLVPMGIPVPEEITTHGRLIFHSSLCCIKLTLF